MIQRWYSSMAEHNRKVKVEGSSPSTIFRSNGAAAGQYWPIVHTGGAL